MPRHSRPIDRSTGTLWPNFHGNLDHKLKASNSGIVTKEGRRDPSVVAMFPLDSDAIDGLPRSQHELNLPQIENTQNLWTAVVFIPSLDIDSNHQHDACEWAEVFGPANGPQFCWSPVGIWTSGDT